MPGTMIVHDTAVLGRITPGSSTAPNVYPVNEHVGVQHIFNWVNSYARSCNGLSNLFILAHGLVNRPMHDARLAMSYRASGGGGEIQLGREGLHLGNISLTAIISGQVARITLLSCSIANNSDGRIRNTRFDGWQLCREFAGYTRAEVIASAVNQDYSRRGNNFVTRFLGLADEIDWSTLTDMEPPVYSFPSDGSEPRRIR